MLDRVRSVIGGPIELDPASAPDNPTKALFFYTECGLEQPWEASSLFLNPPWSKKLAVPPVTWWLTLLADWASRWPDGDGFLVCPASTNAGWFHEYVVPASAVAFPRGRIEYDPPPGGDHGNGGATFDSAIAYFGPKADAFRAAFADRCWVP